MKNHKICKGVLAKVLQLGRKGNRALESLGMIKRKNGFKSKYGYPVLKDGEVTPIRDEERAEMLLKTFRRIPNYENKEGKREEIVQQRRIKNCSSVKTIQMNY